MLDSVMDQYDMARAVLQFIPPDVDHKTWVLVGMALKSEFGDDGFQLFNEWSSGGATYSEKSTIDTYRSIRAEGQTTFGTLIHIAKQHGYQSTGEKKRLEINPERGRVREESAGHAAEMQRQRYIKGAANARALWDRSSPVNLEHPYLQRKQISPPANMREIDAESAAKILGYPPTVRDEELQGRLLVIPVMQMRDNRLSISATELIDESGRKAGNAGGERTGGFWMLDKLPEHDSANVTILLGEGAATVCSAQAASGHTAVAAFSCGNLLPVAQMLRAQFPTTRIVVLGELGNGLDAAKKAAQAGNCQIAIPSFPPGIEGSDFNDLAVACGLNAVKSAIEAAIDAADTWLAPNALAASFEREDYPYDALPVIIRDAVAEFAEHVKAPFPLVAASALGAVSLAVQAHVNARRDETLENPTSLYVLTIADSGERKSTCDKHFMRIIHQYDREQAELFRPQQEAYRADLAAWESKVAGLRAKIQEAARKGADTRPFEADLRNLERDKPNPPRVPRLIYADATPEALAHSLSTRWPTGGVMSSEAGQVLGAHAMSADAIMRNLAQLNVLWDGGDLPIDRKSTESFTVSDVRLTINLMVQEPTLREFYGKSGRLTRGTGFLARFLVAWPESTQGSRLYTEPPIHWPARDRFNQRLSDILMRPIPLNDEGGLTPAVATLSPQAKRRWIDFHNQIERELGLGGELRDVRDIASKTADNAVRLAALFQFFEDGSLVITEDVMEAAARIAAWHLFEARRFFGEIALPDDLLDLIRLDAWLVDYASKKSATQVNTTEILQYASPTKFRKAGPLQHALTHLEAENRVRLVTVGRKKVVVINPALLRKD